MKLNLSHKNGVVRGVGGEVRSGRSFLSFLRPVMKDLMIVSTVDVVSRAATRLSFHHLSSFVLQEDKQRKIN